MMITKILAVVLAVVATGLASQADAADLAHERTGLSCTSLPDGATAGTAARRDAGACRKPGCSTAEPCRVVPRGR